MMLELRVMVEKLDVPTAGHALGLPKNIPTSLAGHNQASEFVEQAAVSLNWCAQGSLLAKTNPTMSFQFPATRW
jgi:hypothetical protein